jgi:hypothetical protein
MRTKLGSHLLAFLRGLLVRQKQYCSLCLPLIGFWIWTPGYSDDTVQRHETLTHKYLPKRAVLALDRLMSSFEELPKRSPDISVTWLITLWRGGGGVWPGGLGTSQKSQNWKGGGVGCHKNKDLHLPFSFYFLFAIIQFSNQINDS